MNLQAMLAPFDGALQRAWCRETSYWPAKWTPENPALGQCAVTALAVHKLLGGRIYKVRIGRSWHYYNDFIPNCGQLDLTKRQYERYINPNTAYWGSELVDSAQLEHSLGARFVLYWQRVTNPQLEPDQHASCPP